MDVTTMKYQRVVFEPTVETTGISRFRPERRPVGQSVDISYLDPGLRALHLGPDRVVPYHPVVLRDGTSELLDRVESFLALHRDWVAALTVSNELKISIERSRVSLRRLFHDGVINRKTAPVSGKLWLYRTKEHLV